MLQMASSETMRKHYADRHKMDVSAFFFCWICKFFAPLRDDLWHHVEQKHGTQKDVVKADLSRGLCRPAAPKKRKAAAQSEDRTSPKRSRATSYSKELGPAPEFFVEEAESNNNRKVRHRTPEDDDQLDEPVRSPGTPPLRRQDRRRSRDKEPETAPRDDPEPDVEDTPSTTDRATQTPNLRDSFGWDHHHTLVREVRKNGTVVTTEDFIWRVGHGSVKFPCCESAAEARSIDDSE